ncbi:MAG: hypothetical protein EA402_02300 [Planctomycetota bacterium]|nr:MAG: hypothetical protein EA402_02300 [Planctomycetota bacterium]
MFRQCSGLLAAFSLGILVLLPLSALEAEAEVGVEVVEETAAAEGAEAVGKSPAEQELAEMRAELERLRLLQDLREARLRDRIQESQMEIQSIEAELSLAAARRRAELATMEAEQERLQAVGALQEARQQAEMLQQRLAQKHRQMEFQLAEIEMQGEALEHRHIQRQRERESAAFEHAQQLRQQSLTDTKFAMQQDELKLAALEQRQMAEAVIATGPERLAEPFVDGVLHISDRRIDLNEPIISGTGDWIARRIAFFNNESPQDPIFLVIDYCPGGSIMDGEIILRAMASSKAPVHVVVKNLAASMAAIILGDAPHSYALPNALIMHHQPMSYTFGNLAQQKEWVRLFENWAHRIHAPTAERMGITIEEFYARMYEQSVSGDWMEFADRAQELHWVQHVVREIREDNVRRRPEDPSPYQAYWGSWSSAKTATGERIRLPRPRALDFYFLYNSDGRFFIGE